MKKMKTYASFDEYLEDQSPGNQEIIRALRKFVRRTAPGLNEAVKWGNHIKVHDRSTIDERAFAALLRQAAKK